MRTSLVAGAIVGALLVPSAADASSIAVGDTIYLRSVLVGSPPPFHPPFVADLPPLGTSPMSPPLTPPDFITFCLEQGAPIEIDYPLEIVGISTYVNGSPSTPLRWEVAMIYYAVRTGFLDALWWFAAQQDIWRLQGGNPALDIDLVALQAALSWPTGFLGGVRVVTLEFEFTEQGQTFRSDHQDILDMNGTIPEPGSLLLLGTGLVLAGFGLRRRTTRR